jgi:leucyl/phenylalanyl-tRNA--protein transferase
LISKEEITPEQLLAAYARGYFPMAKSKDDPELYWFSPDMRGVIPLEGFRVPRSLAKDLCKNPFEVRVDIAFREVIAACGERQDTWINENILRLYTALYDRGFAHSVECWRNGKLVGGLYGLALGGAFFGESMFSLESNASKAALIALVERLKTAGYVLLDAQYTNEHLRQFGIIGMPKAEYLEKLREALTVMPEPLA